MEIQWLLDCVDERKLLSLRVILYPLVFWQLLDFNIFARFEIVMANTLSFDESLEFAICLEVVNSILSVAVD